MKRTLFGRRPRFSLRVLLLIPVLVAGYFLLADITKAYGPAAVAIVIERDHGGGTPAYVAPLLFEYWQMKATGARTVEVEMHYYAWLFGTALKLPITRTAQDAFPSERRADDILDDCLISDWPPRK